MSAPAPSILRGLTDAEYDAIPAIRSSDLPPALRSWAHFHHAKSSPREDTSAFRLGRLAHAMIRGDASAFLPVSDPINPKTGRPFGSETEAFAAHFRAAREAHPGLEIVTTAEWLEAEAFRNAFRASPDAMASIEGSEPEPVFLGTIEGAAVKSRVDYWNEKLGRWTDPKTTSRSALEFSREAVRLNYPLKAAFQSLVIESAIRASPAELRWPAIEKSPPHGVIVYRMSVTDLAPWRAKARAIVRGISKCSAEKSWPGYSSGVVDLDIPPWGYPDGGAAIPLGEDFT